MKPWDCKYGVFYFHMAADDWTLDGAQKMFVDPIGLAYVIVEDTFSLADLYADATLKDTYVFKLGETESHPVQSGSGSLWETHVNLLLGGSSGNPITWTETNAYWIKWGYISSLFVDPVTLNWGTKSGGGRSNGVTVQSIVWRAVSESFSVGLTTINWYNVTHHDTSNVIDSAALSVTESLGELAFGDDYNNVMDANCTLESVRFNERFKFRKQATANDAQGLLTTDVVSFNNCDQIEIFYQGGDSLLGWDNCVFENPDIGMPSTGNAQTTPDTKGIYYRKCRVINPTTADASILHSYNTFWIGNEIEGSDNFDLTLKLNHTLWYTGSISQHTIFQCVPVQIRVVDENGDVVSGARVQIFSNLSESTHAEYIDTTGSTLERSDFDLTTDANGDLPGQPDLVWQEWNPAGASSQGEQTSLMSAHVTAGRLANTTYSPFRMTVSKTGYKTVVQYAEFKQSEIVMEVSLGVPQTQTGPVFITGILP